MVDALRREKTVLPRPGVFRMESASSLPDQPAHESGQDCQIKSDRTGFKRLRTTVSAVAVQNFPAAALGSLLTDNHSGSGAGGNPGPETGCAVV
jgi:hypothetical protein